MVHLYGLICRLWRVPATLPYPDLIFTTRTLPGKVLKISGFRVVTIYICCFHTGIGDHLRYLLPYSLPRFFPLPYPKSKSPTRHSLIGSYKEEASLRAFGSDSPPSGSSSAPAHTQWCCRWDWPVIWQWGKLTLKCWHAAIYLEMGATRVEERDKRDPHKRRNILNSEIELA